MNWKGHLKWGFIVITAFLIIQIIDFFIGEIPYLDITESSRFMLFGYAVPSIIIAYIFGLYASLFPDVDVGTSKAFVITYAILIILSFYFAMMDYMIGLFTGLGLMLIMLGLKHRGIMHKWYSGVVLGIFFGILFGSILIGLYFTIGFMVHLICDRKKPYKRNINEN